MTIIFWFIRGILSKIFNFLFYYYIYFYRIALIMAFVLMWKGLRHVNKLHLREKLRLCGFKLNKYINSNTEFQQIWYNIKFYILIELCTVNDLFAGFFEGCINRQSSMCLKQCTTIDTQTTQLTNTMSIQTDTIEPEIIEIIKEVPVEVIKEIDNTNNQYDNTFVKKKTIFKVKKRNINKS